MRSLTAVTLLVAVTLAGCMAPNAPQPITVTDTVTVTETITIQSSSSASEAVAPPQPPPPPPGPKPEQPMEEESWETLQGNSDNVAQFETSRPLVRVTIRGNANWCGGQDNFVVRVLDENGARQDLWANEIGYHRAIRYFLLNPGVHSLEVRSGHCGNWDIHVAHPGTTTDGPEELVRMGPMSPPCFFLNQGLHRFSFWHVGDSNFIVKVYPVTGSKTHLLVNVIGDYEGTVPLSTPAGATYCMDVYTSSYGEWGLSIQSPTQ